MSLFILIIVGGAGIALGAYFARTHKTSAGQDLIKKQAGEKERKFVCIFVY